VEVFEPDATLPFLETEAPRLAPMREWQGPRVLYVGSSAAHKNLPVLWSAMSQLTLAVPEARLFATLSAQEVPAGVVALGRMSPAELRQAYVLATALVVPSLIETVCLPIVEGFEAGLAVVAADRPFAREVAGDAATYFDPRSPDSCAAALTRVLRDRDYRAALGSAALVRAKSRSKRRPYHALVDSLVVLGNAAEHNE